MRVDHITALEFLDAESRAARNAADKPRFKLIKDELKRHAQVQERLVFEFLEMAWQTLQRGEDPAIPAIRAFSFGSSVGPQRLLEYTAWIEKFVTCLFKLMRRPHEQTGYDSAFTFAFSMALTALRVKDYDRFRAVLDSLRQSCDEADPRSKILGEAEESEWQRRERLRQIRKEAMLSQAGNEESANSNWN